MPKISPALADHLKQDVTALCHCWRLRRRDGTVMGFTDHDQPLSVDGTLFKPDSGFSATEARRSLGLAVDAMDVEGALSAADIREEDIIAGLYDGATVETLLVHWRAPDEFALLRRAVVGQIARRDGRFVAELESPEAALDQPNGRTVRRNCDAELGDSRCGVQLDTPAFKANGALIRMEGGCARVSGLENYDDGWFAHGVLTWISGASKGRSERVMAHQKGLGGTTLNLWRDAASQVAEADSFTIVAGCDKQFSTCKAKFANSVNFRGFPHLPGNDAGYNYVTEGQRFDGGPLVE